MDQRISFTKALGLAFHKYNDFSSRSTRAEYWYWKLFVVLLAVIAGFVEETIGIEYLLSVINVALAVPSIAVTIRRFHDLGRSGWWSTLEFTVIGAIPMYIWLMRATDPDSQDHQVSPVNRNLVIGILIIISIFLETKIIKTFSVSAGSNLPTIFPGDYLFCKSMLISDDVIRKDIILFPYPRDPEITYIKRVIGLPGETIEIRNDQVFIDGNLLEEPYAYFDPQLRFQSRATAPVSFFGPMKIPEGKLFVMGDNRYNSVDSRFWGFIDADSVVGKASMIYWSKEPSSSWNEGYRAERFFTFPK
jgi:signal peptidase I